MNIKLGAPPKKKILKHNIMTSCLRELNYASLLFGQALPSFELEF